MVSLGGGKIAVFGGLGTEVFNDFRVFDSFDNKWSTMHFDNGNVPDLRFGHSLNIWRNQLVVLAGSGP
jgi:hypothetical protein